MGDLFGGGAADAAKDAANVAAAGQRQGLEYLQERERAPMHYRDQALAILANELGIPAILPTAPTAQAQSSGTPIQQLAGSQTDEISNRLPGSLGEAVRAAMAARGMGNSKEELRNNYYFGDSMSSNYAPVDTSAMPSLTESAINSPLYRAIMDSQRAGEQAIARTASATGGLRGGSAIGDIAGFGRDLQNKALLDSYNQRLGMIGSLAGLQTMAPQIAQQYSNIGNTVAQGQVAAANAKQQGLGSLLGLAGNVGGFIMGGPAGAQLGGLLGGII